ncbi:MAG: sensor histidine kinase, partial [Anaerolineales bacterium]|nr:sensor histidine kinase [Anaerolineales bacterium]
GIGRQVGVAMENARLYQQAEEIAAATERGRLARELHDAVSQTLFSASLIADVLPRLWERNPAEAQKRLVELRQLTRGALAEMRTLLLELRPAALEQTPLAELLRQLAEAAAGRGRVDVTVKVRGEAPLPVEIKTALYRIAQEALNNVIKHAGAAHALVTLEQGPQRTLLRISDDGQGFDPAPFLPGHLGLQIMQERAQSIGASIRVTSKAGKGTIVTIIRLKNGSEKE